MLRHSSTAIDLSDKETYETGFACLAYVFLDRTRKKKKQDAPTEEDQEWKVTWRIWASKGLIVALTWLPSWRLRRLPKGGGSVSGDGDPRRGVVGERRVVKGT